MPESVLESVPKSSSMTNASAAPHRETRSAAAQHAKHEERLPHATTTAKVRWVKMLAVA
ncbi:hypothetical protein [Candidatus Alkanophaga liquidiphilum]